MNLGNCISGLSLKKQKELVKFLSWKFKKPRQRLEDEEWVDRIPLSQTPRVTREEREFFDEYYKEWQFIQGRIKEKLGYEKYGKERYEQIKLEKKKIRDRDRYFLKNFIPPEFFKGKEIQHFWRYDKDETKYDYLCIWEKYENQVLELRYLQSLGYDIFSIAKEIRKIIERKENG